jgi:hypothetical protein
MVLFFLFFWKARARARRSCADENFDLSEEEPLLVVVNEDSI